jgi:hypothetical protein
MRGRKKTVIIDGSREVAQPGFHVFRPKYPPRIECYIRGNNCEYCRGFHNIWMTDDWRWQKLPRLWWSFRLCVDCYLRILKAEAWVQGWRRRRERLRRLNGVRR